ncbi:MAG TPA: glycosyltransferase [Jatrophihabitans sp.]|nr:glycosyltransferase [Jatrophihabitans sp.]
MISRVAVVVPAADEQHLIAGCLTALRRAACHLRDATPHPPQLDVVVVLDACRDRTADVVAEFPEVRMIEAAGRCVGAARALGTASALAATGEGHDVWTAHTDADSQVPVNWLRQMVRAADGGADLVLGTVDPGTDLPLGTRHAWRLRHSPDDGHRHVHGANLGIRAATLRRVGGWRPLRSGEDVDLATRVAGSGATVERTGAIPVYTSARHIGRAPAGFSSYLRTLGADSAMRPAVGG